jgi:hypothetical protein
MKQTCSCRCGSSRFVVDGEPIGRLFCHCKICQAFNARPYADVTFFAAGAVTLPANSAVTFKQYRRPPAVDRGSCPACGGPVVEFLALGPLKMLSIVPYQSFERPSELPEPSRHVFYHRRTADVSDSLPKISGYWPSEISVLGKIIGGLFRPARAA